MLEASSASGAAIWRLIDPDSRIIAKTTDPASGGTLGLTLTGTYTLYIRRGGD